MDRKFKASPAGAKEEKSLGFRNTIGMSIPASLTAGVPVCQ